MTRLVIQHTPGGRDHCPCRTFSFGKSNARRKEKVEVRGQSRLFACVVLVEDYDLCFKYFSWLFLYLFSFRYNEVSIVTTLENGVH